MKNNHDKNRKIRVAVLFGGKSAEHEVSLMSARSVYDALDKTKYEVALIGITKSGRWLPLPQRFLSKSSNESVVKQEPREEKFSLSLAPARAGFFLSPDNDKQTAVDVVFPVLHGPYGEDGSIQGLLKLMDVPFVGASVLGSAVGMDKDVMKRLLRDAGLPIARFAVVHHRKKTPSYSSVRRMLGTPFFVKPANLGSSVGISRVSSEKEFKTALKVAFGYDTKILLEEYVEGREIECSVLGNERPIASVPGEVITDKTRHSFYSYEAKYLDENGAELAIPAKLSKNQTKMVQKLAVEVFKKLCCEGMGRVDFFLKENGELIVNEINTIPGFTSISMYPKLWEASGISYKKLLDRLIKLGLERAEKKI